jgi:hypothetical protein
VLFRSKVCYNDRDICCVYLDGMAESGESLYDYAVWIKNYLFDLLCFCSSFAPSRYNLTNPRS